MNNIIKTILAEWKGKDIPLIIPRKLDLQSYLTMKVNKIVVLNGFRRVGKTYILYDLANELLKLNSREEVVFINFEDERIPLKTEFLSDLLPTSEEIFNKKIKYLFLDELHNIPNWSKWLRRVYDANQNMRIFVSGSSSRMSEEESPIILKALTEYLLYGGLPEIVLEDKNKKFELAQSYYATAIKRDIVERYGIKNEESLKTLIKLLLDSRDYSISKAYNNLKSLGNEVGKSN